MTASAACWLTVAGLLAMAGLTLAEGGPGAAIGAAPLVLLAILGLRPMAYWAIGTAIVMLPYFSYGVMEMITDPQDRLRAMAVASLAIGVFLAALDARRRSAGVSGLAPAPSARRES